MALRPFSYPENPAEELFCGQKYKQGAQSQKV
jgi:hypothetical protein